MGEINFAYQSGANLYAMTKNSVGLFCNKNTLIFENLVSANWANYAVSLAENGTTGQYTASMLAITVSGLYTIDIYRRAGVAPLPTDVPPIGTGDIHWNGRFLAEISLADLIGAPAIFGSVMSSPVPTTTAFKVSLDKSMAVGSSSTAFINMFLTLMPGNFGGAPVGGYISNCSIVSQSQLSLTLLTPLPVAPAAGDPIAISV